MKIAIVGLGLIGGSMALDLKASGYCEEVWGVDENPLHAEEALARGLVTRILPLNEACNLAELIVLATPVSALVRLLPQVLDQISDQQVVTDVGSTKSEIIQSVQDHPKRAQYVAAHPMAGTEFSGPSAARSHLFQGKAAVICNAEESLPIARDQVEKLFETLGMRIIRMAARAHDLQVAYVSHLSHISSFVLAGTVLSKEKDTAAIFNLASGGFESTVRLAKSSPAMWRPIFEQNQGFVLEALGAYIEHLQDFRKTIENRDWQKTEDLMTEANQIGRVLSTLQTKKVSA